MNKTRLLTCLALVLALCTSALAADPSSMTDIRGHWAEDVIADCMTEGLYYGVSDTEFDPEGTMTRGMFITVLGRLAGIVPEEYQTWYADRLYSDVPGDVYYTPYIVWGTRYGIVYGIGGGAFAPDDPVTREQIAAMVVRFTSIYNYSLSAGSDLIADSFSDGDQISGYAVDCVESLRMTGILNGCPNGDGTYRFEPQRAATRAECAAIFSRVRRAIHPYEGRTLTPPEAISLSPETQELHPGESVPLVYTFSPAETSNQTVTWVSSAPEVAAVDQNGRVTALAEGSAEVYAYAWNGRMAVCTVTVTPQVSLAYAGESYADKCRRVFGQTVDDYRTYYDLNDTSYLVEVPVRVWDFTDSAHTTKYTKTIYLQVHANLADTVRAIFEEIYNGDEQFPIYSAGGYYRSSYSEHTPGLAIDINPDSNYYCSPDGTAITGSHWDPENDPYSIPLEGDVAEAFAKYGFTRGIYWRNGYKDYMHFSYFGT